MYDGGRHKADAPCRARHAQQKGGNNGLGVRGYSYKYIYGSPRPGGKPAVFAVAPRPVLVPCGRADIGGRGAVRVCFQALHFRRHPELFGGALYHSLPPRRLRSSLPQERRKGIHSRRLGQRRKGLPRKARLHNQRLGLFGQFKLRQGGVLSGLRRGKGGKKDG